MIFDKEPLPPPHGMTFKKMLLLPVSNGPWRETDRYLCGHCIQNAFHHPHTNDIWGCRQCGTTTTKLRRHFMSLDDELSSGLPVQTRRGTQTAFEPDKILRRRTPLKDQLPEFKVTLQRMAKGERAVNPDDRKNHGARTKLGGVPNWIQLIDETPICEECKERMTFVAQIDSLEHRPEYRPGRSEPKRRARSMKPWMFCDVGMIYVFYCFNCSKTRSVTQCY